MGKNDLEKAFSFKLPINYEMTPKCKGRTKRYQPKSLQEILMPIVDTLLKPEALTWDIKHVLEWLVCLDLECYVPIFIKNKINGRKLLLINPRSLSKIKIEDFKVQSKLLFSFRELFKVEFENYHRNISLPPRYPNTHFILHNTCTGPKYENVKLTEFLRDIKILRPLKHELNHFEKLHRYLQHKPENQVELFGGVKRSNLYYVKPNPCREIVPFCKFSTAKFYTDDEEINSKIK